MKIAVTSTGTELTSEMDPRFGRAAFFILVDPESMDFEVIENTQNLTLPQGAGIQAGKTIINAKAKILITGNCGPKAFTVLEQAGIDTIVGAGGRVIDAIQQYKNGLLAPTSAANVEGHWV